MRTISKSFKVTLSCLALISTISAYTPVFAESADTQNHDSHHNAQNSLDWPGIYNGFLPCDDCMGLKTSLALNKNSSYVLIYQYTGKSPRDHVEKGKFTWGEQNNTIVLTSKDGSTSRQYFVGENILIQLDSKGERPTGKLADHYILRRTDMTDSEPAHGGH